MAATIKAIKAPKVSVKAAKVSKVAVGHTAAAKMTEQVIKTGTPKLAKLNLIKSPSVKTTAPAAGTLTKPKFFGGPKVKP